MRSTQKTVRGRWLQLVQASLEEVCLVPGDEHWRLPEDDPNEGKLQSVSVVGFFRSTDPVGVLTIQGHFQGDRLLKTMLWCAASESPCSDDHLVAPRLRDHRTVTARTLIPSLQDTLRERAEVLRRISIGMSPPFEFSRENDRVVWR